MKFVRVPFALVFCAALSGHALAQQNLVYNHYFLDPYLYNPSFIASDGYSELNLNFRKQWSQFEGAPTTLTANLQMPINYRMAWGVNVHNDKAGVLQTNTGAASFAYKVYLGRSTEVNHRIGFGLSMGYTMSRIDLSMVDDPNDPSLTNSNTSSLSGQFGMHYQYNNLKIGFALPRLFANKFVSEDAFNEPEFEALQNTFYSISYNIRLSERVAFEPSVIYRTNEVKKDQFEALGAIKIDNLLWAGGSYRQDYGPAAFIGFVLKEKVKVGYAYEFAPEVVDGFGTGSHEVHVSLRLGRKQVTRPSSTSATDLPVEAPPEQEEIVEQPRPEEKPVEEPAVVEQRQETPVEPSAVVEPPKQDVVVEQPVVTPVTPEVQPETKPAEPVVAKRETDVPPGHYVIVGSFQHSANANKYARELRASGYPAAAIYYAPRKFHYVHVGTFKTLDQARAVRTEYRAKSRFFSSGMRGSYQLSSLTPEEFLVYSIHGDNRTRLVRAS